MAEYRILKRDNGYTTVEQSKKLEETKELRKTFLKLNKTYPYPKERGK